jgi:hypothetical protein
MSRRRPSQKRPAARPQRVRKQTPPPSLRLSLLTGPLAKAGGAATAVAAIGTAVFLFFPNLKPKANHCAASKAVKIVGLDPTGASFRQYLDTVQASPRGHSARELELRGFIVSYQVRTTGYPGEKLPLKYTLVDATTGMAVPGHANQLAIEVPQHACTDALGEPIWVPPPTRRRYYVVLSVYDTRGIVRDTAKSPAFSLPSESAGPGG